MGKKNKIKMTDLEVFHYLDSITSPSDSDIELILTMYRKYIDPNVRYVKNDCKTCNDPIVNIYWVLINYFRVNKNNIQ